MQHESFLVLHHDTGSNKESNGKICCHYETTQIEDLPEIGENTTGKGKEAAERLLHHSRINRKCCEATVCSLHVTKFIFSIINLSRLGEGEKQKPFLAGRGIRM